VGHPRETATTILAGSGRHPQRARTMSAGATTSRVRQTGEAPVRREGGRRPRTEGLPQERHRIDRLQQDHSPAVGHELPMPSRLIVCRDEDDGDLVALVSELAEDTWTIQARHRHVDHSAVGWRAARRLDERLAGRETPRAVSSGLDQERQSHADREIVVHDAHKVRGRSAGRLDPGRDSGWSVPTDSRSSRRPARPVRAACPVVRPTRQAVAGARACRQGAHRRRPGLIARPRPPANSRLL